MKESQAYPNPSGYDMPKPSRILFLDDISGNDLFTRWRVSELSQLVHSDSPAIRLSKEELIIRLKRKISSVKQKGLYPELDFLIGVGATGTELAGQLDLNLPIATVTPFRSKDQQGKNTIRTRSGFSLSEEISRSIKDIDDPSIGIVDDTIFSGNTMLEITNSLNSLFSSPSIIGLALTSVPSFQNPELKDKVKILSAFQLRTTSTKKRGLNSIDVKDFVSDDGLHLPDGSSIAFMNEENWMRSWFGKNYSQAIAICREIKDHLE